MRDANLPDLHQDKEAQRDNENPRREVEGGGEEERGEVRACRTRTNTSETLSFGVPSVPRGGRHSASPDCRLKRGN